ncbi:MAG: hypothetical protein IJ932_06645 [Ruminococcus sp.]|nr:hypothetical protein [Ruminococcus sp.]
MKTVYLTPKLNIEQIKNSDVLAASTEIERRDNTYTAVDSFSDFDSSGFDMSSFL